MMPIISGGIAVTGTYETGIWYAFRLGEGKQVPFTRFGNEKNTGFVPDALVKLGGAMPGPAASGPTTSGAGRDK